MVILGQSFIDSMQTVFTDQHERGFFCQPNQSARRGKRRGQCVRRGLAGLYSIMPVD